jgi:hypothetical protein
MEVELEPTGAEIQLIADRIPLVRIGVAVGGSATTTSGHSAAVARRPQLAPVLKGSVRVNEGEMSLSLVVRTAHARGSPDITGGQQSMANWKHEITLTVRCEADTADGRVAADIAGQQIVREMVPKVEQVAPRAPLLAARCQPCIERMLPRCLERWASGLSCWDLPPNEHDRHPGHPGLPRDGR